jgi:hypothetical protein
MLSLLILVPLAVITQEPFQASVNGPERSRQVAADRNAADEPAPRADGQQPRAPEPPPPPVARRRRGSMVGYIDDAIIESKVRVRFDAGFENTVPDRAEFFYAKCGCYRDGPAPDPDAPGPRPGAASDLDFQQVYVWAEYAVNDRFSAFGHVPVRWIQPQSFVPGSADGPGFPDQSGFGDLRTGVKFGLIVSDTQSVTAQTQVYFPTGDASKGLGVDHASIEPALLYYQNVSDVVALESQVGVWVPFGGSSPVPGATDGDFSGTVLFYGIGPSFEVYRGDRLRLAPVIELVGWRVTSGFQTLPGGTPVRTLPADGTNLVNLKFGARVSIDRGSFYIGYGHGLTDDTWYDDIIRFEYRHAF